MRKSTIFLSVILLLLTASFLSAQTVNVTFRVNTATIPDTITAESAVVQVRGGTAPLTWDNATAGQMVNVGGDYWEVTLAMPQNTDIAYKFFANAMGDGTGSGWEANLNTSNTNRSLTTTTSDTVLPVKFFNIKNGSAQDAMPFTPTDSMDVWFRVNVHRLIQYSNFDPDQQVIGIRGGTPALDWGNTIVLAPETAHDNGEFSYPADYFWSGAVPIDPAAVTFGDTIQYKFVIGDKPDGNNNIEWESVSNRKLPVSTTEADTTVPWVYWNNEAPDIAAGQDTVTIKFTADLSTAIAENGYTPGDTLLVRYGDNGTAIPATDTLTKEGLFGNIYSVESEVYNVSLGEKLQYNYYVQFQGVADRELFFDFTSTSTTGEAEKRKLDLPSTMPTTTIEVYDTVESNQGMHRQPRFRNLNILPKDVTVYWEVDLRPPYFQVLLDGDTLNDIQGSIDIGPAEADSIFSWGVWINGPATGDWTTWGADLRNAPGKKMWDDGTSGGDMTAGDSIYTTTWFYSGPDSNDAIGQVYKFGIYGGDNEAGQGGFGNNHAANIPVDNPGTTTPETHTIHSQFGSINQGFYSRWDYDLGVVGIDNPGDVQVVETPALDQNYPNPFNPVTTIRFVLPKAQDVKLVIYNSLGQKVTTLLNGKQRQGSHVVQWNGINSKGIPVGSGIYFYRFTTDNYSKTMKMMLMK